MPQPDYHFCPYCAAAMVDRMQHGALRRVCAGCGFVHYRDPKVAVVALATDGDRVLLIRRAVAPMKGMWALPGGFMDAGELPEGALRRELLEEVGLEAQVGALLGIFPLYSGDEVGGIVLAYAAAPLPGADAPAAGDDVLDARWFEAGHLPPDLAFESTQLLLESWERAAAQAARPDAVDQPGSLSDGQQPWPVHKELKR